MDVEIEPPHTHHHATGHPWLDKALPLSAVLISVVSIGIALHHGKVMEALVQQNERLVQANSLPHIQLFGSNADAEGRERISFGIANRGVGPAEIRSVQILIDGRPVTNVAEIMKACCDVPRPGVTTSTLFGTMIEAGQEIQYIQVRPTVPATLKSARQLDAARRAGRIVTRVCYCSVFDECWMRSTDSDARPQKVDVCPMPEPQYRY